MQEGLDAVSVVHHELGSVGPAMGIVALLFGVGLQGKIDIVHTLVNCYAGASCQKKKYRGNIQMHAIVNSRCTKNGPQQLQSQRGADDHITLAPNPNLGINESHLSMKAATNAVPANRISL